MQKNTTTAPLAAIEGVRKSRGGRRYTHSSLVAANLDHIAMEAQAAQQELTSGYISAAQAEPRFRRFAAEVERLAREGVRHLQAAAAQATKAAA